MIILSKLILLLLPKMPKPKLKLDENFSPNLTILFKNEGFDTHSVLDEALSGEPDTVIYQQCLSENRCLITFDTDFCNILRFPAHNTAGIIVIRPHRNIKINEIRLFALQIIDILKQRDPTNCLWVLDAQKLRIRYPHDK